MKIRIRAAAALAAVSIAFASPSLAVEKCKVKVDSHTGVISLSASGVSGTLLWGSESGSEDNAFFNPSCVSGDMAKGCQLADPATLASKTPPAGCTVHLADASSSCSVWIRGCSPGQRDAAPGGALVFKDASGKIVGASDDAGNDWIRQDGSALLRIPMQGGSNFQITGAYYYPTSDCSGPASIAALYGAIRDVVIHNSNGPVYYGSGAGVSTSVLSTLQAGVMINSPLDCSLNFPGSTFVAPNGCCSPYLATFPLVTPTAADLSNVAFPIAPALQ